MTKLRAILLGLASVSCAGDDGGTTAADTTAVDTATTDAGGSGTEGTATVADGSATDAAGTAAETTDATAADTGVDDSSGGAATTTGAGDDAGTSTGGPTSGPGVLPGESGLEAFCRRYVECGGTYYDGEQACIDASYDYWGDCPSRAAALDAFGACMADIECTDWSPDAYNPASTPCAEQWQGVGASDPC